MNGPLELLQQRMADALIAAFGQDAADADPMIRPSQNPRFGDYQSNAAMPLAKRLGQPPRQVATAIVGHLAVDDVCDTPELAGPGFINLRLRNDYLAAQAAHIAADPHLAVASVDGPQRVVVDYSSPNVAKEMHVGHLRSTVIGDAIARTLEWLGHDVIRQNHVGDWGTQFGMLIEYMIDQGATGDAGSFKVADLNALYQQAKQKFDGDAPFAERARRRVVDLQAGDEMTLALWRLLVHESQRHFDQVYGRLHVLMSQEDVRGESQYNVALPDVWEDLTRRNIAIQSENATVVFVDGYEAPMIVRKSDGGFGYDATDLAALRYRVDELQANRLVYVTDARQKQHFDMVFKVADRAGWLKGVRADHVAFGMVLGEDNKPFKTRSGENVKLIDLLDEAEQRAAGIVAEKNPELTGDEQKHVAGVVGIGAVKYADLSNDRARDYVFSWSRMLAMDGNTAPYLQYAYARIRSIFRKGDVDPASLVGVSVIVGEPAERALILKLLQFSPIIHSVAEHLEPHRLCNYLYDLATTFSSFYEACPVLRGADEATRQSRLLLCDLTARTLKQGLKLLGINVLDRM